MKYSIIITGYNCEDTVRECIDSVLNQTHDKFNIIVVDDGSTDGTYLELMRYARYMKIDVLSNAVSVGALRGRYEAVNGFPVGDVVCFLGMDDKLAPNALEVLNKYYSDPKIKMTYGSWVDFNGKRLMPTRPYDDDVFKNKSFRKVQWKATALNTFKTDLIKKVPKDVLMDNGEFFKTCTDLAYSFPCLEMCTKEEVGVVTEPIYIYRVNNNHKGKAEVREKLKHIKPL